MTNTNPTASKQAARPPTLCALGLAAAFAALGVAGVAALPVAQATGAGLAESWSAPLGVSATDMVTAADCVTVYPWQVPPGIAVDPRWLP